MDKEKQPDDSKAEETPAESPAPEAGGKPKTADKNNKWQRVKSWYLERKKWAIPLTVVLLLAVLALVPFTRYALAGVVKKSNVELKVVDATANSPVSGATVSIGAISTETDSNGVADLHGIKAGHRSAIISKKYYQSRTVSILAPIFSQKSIPKFELTATGRQVKIKASNLIDGTPLQDVDIKVADITAKTDKTGSATVVLPVGQPTQKATLSLSGYNDATETVKISDGKIEENDFTLTPSGTVYFLSNLSGKIDVVKTNLDGTGRQTVLAGTGNEDDNNTVLLASRDWKYLALLSRRAGNNPTLYLISTADDNLATIDSGNVSFNLAGWAGDNFVYTATSNSAPQWQAGRQALKSYNASTKKLTVLDQTSASGTSLADYLSQQFGNVYAYNSQIYYVKQWLGGYNMDTSPQLAAKAATFNSVQPDGGAKTAIKSFSPAATAPSFDLSLDVQVVKPGSFELYTYDGLKDNFYTYANGQVTTDSTETTSKFYGGSYSTYLVSPSGSKTFWSEIRDGKNTLFVGDSYGQNGKQIAALSDYSPYGWYSDNYLLVSKNSSELYIMAKDGSQTPVKISDYHKPAIRLYGYGGGYGGL